MTFFSRLLATGFYVGYTPVAPGTAGSMLGLFIYWIIPGSETLFFGIAIATLTLAGAWTAGRIERDSGIKDNQIIVIDEIVGTLITLWAIEKTFIWLATGVILFRIFDIVKPVPVRTVEKVPGGWGVMLDDMVAGAYSLICLRLIQQVVVLLS